MNDQAKPVDVRGCQRCGQYHLRLAFAPLANAVDDFQWWAACPVTKQPILMAMRNGVQETATPRETAMLTHPQAERRDA